MSRAIVVQVTLYDDETGEVERQLVKHTDSHYGHEVERAFEKIGRQVVEVIDPEYYT